MPARIRSESYRFSYAVHHNDANKHDPHPLLYASFLDFRQNRKLSKMFRMSLTGKNVDYIFKESLNVHIFYSSFLFPLSSFK